MPEGSQPTPLAGVFAYVATPITPSGDINAEALGRHCDDLIRRGINGLTPLGSTGEFAYLDSAQRERVVAVVIEAAAGRVPVLPGVASTSTANALKQVDTYCRLGADGIVAVLETYFPVGQPEAEAYFTAIADRAGVPVIVYTNPSFQRSDLAMETLVRLARHPQIAGLKDASSNTGRLLSLANRCGEELGLFAASAHIAVAVMLLGGRGIFAGPAALVPEAYGKLYALCTAGRWDDAMALQRRLWPLNELFARYNLAACVKAALDLQGIGFGDPILPQRAAPAAARTELAAVLEDLATL
jgi:4-hydroxy-tetrahydrodipicolinate synthase